MMIHFLREHMKEVRYFFYARKRGTDYRGARWLERIGSLLNRLSR